MPRRSAESIAGSRTETVGAAVSLASVIGLDGLTIGRLADELGMSKSGLIGRFGSKQDLQLAVVRRAAEIFTDAVWRPAADHPPGLGRLDAICDAWIAYLGDCPFPGGCFMTTVSVEFDARTGALHDTIAGTMARWLRVLEHEAGTALAAGELPPSTDPAAVAFTINALAVGTNCAFQLHGDTEALRRGRDAMAAVLRA